jgi:RNA polymerase sigma-70 factor (ECF subfamily)
MSLTSADFTRVYRAEAEAMLVYLTRRLWDGELAADVLAETFAVAIERAGQYRGRSERELSAWVWAIARSLVSAAERHGEVERRHAETLGLDRRALDAAELERLDDLAGLALLREQIARHLDELPQEQRAAVRLRMIEGLDYDELSAELGISKQATRARVSRGLRSLRRQITAEARDEGGR